MTDVRESGPNLPLEIAHVLFMDIVAYSMLPMDRQQQLLVDLQEAVRANSEFARSQANDDLFRLPTGDGMALVFFRDPEAPVRCALELSRALRSHPEIKLRMGIHSGPVYRVPDINANRNVAGGGINVAQRVMDCGDAGHILVSEEVAKVLQQLSGWEGSFKDLGEIEVKHGVRIHLFNLYTEDAGNPTMPQKLSAAAARIRAARSVRRWKIALPAVAIVILGVLIGGWLYHARGAHALSETDTVVLADFTNTTGDAVFDGTLRQGLAVQLEQSPFLSLVSDERIQQTLRLMGQPADAKLTPEIARHLCQRAGSKAYLSGSIVSLGSQYVLGLKAVNCLTGDTLAEEQERATGKEQVLSAMDKAAPKLRAKLGESLNTVKKLDTPIEQATTPSLEALQTYSLGRRTMVEKGDSAAAVPLFQRAILLDPNFAMAYASLGACYFNVGERGLAVENMRKAHELRERVSEREKFYIESHYYHFVTGDLEKAQQTYELWAQTYPRDGVPRYNLGAVCQQLGQYDEGLVEVLEALRLSPDASDYANVAIHYLNLGRLQEARATADEALAKKLDSPFLRLSLYRLAFLQNNEAEMAQQVVWAVGKPWMEGWFQVYEGNTAAYSGRLGRAREFWRQAVASAERAEDKETAGGYEANAARGEALFGNPAEARQRAAAALGLSAGRDVHYGAGLALALAGDAARAQTLADDLAKRFPEDTLVQFNYLPTLRAQLALNRNDSAEAIRALQAAAPYELGYVLYRVFPVYVRGEAYLAARQGRQAAAEFQKILDHRGVVWNDTIGALAHLGLARAYALQGDTTKASAAYEDFFALWKDADSDIPILKQAKAEYARLK